MGSAACAAGLGGEPPPGVRTATFAIARDGAPLAVRATWPDQGENLPIIVFSHGMGGSGDAYTPLAHAWAAHGYVVLQPTHPDSLKNRSPAERLRAVRDRAAMVRDPDLLAAWDDRPREVALVLDHLDDLAGVGLDLGRLDRDHVGIGGHSFGAHTAALCGGMAPLGVSRFAEPRADAIALLSPQGVGGGITEASYGHLTLPTLVVTGSEDRSPVTGQGPDWRLTAWSTLGAREAWLLFLDGADHGLGGISALPRRDPELADAVIETTTTFWDAELRGDVAARERLDAGGSGSGRVHLTRKAEP